ncbi:hypothetical protein F8M41_025572 [Gigaspora margarita]|uniref:Uncharacterized protein n=1 Tax=Gigaspora margarita TaxID=4874 RepID=A0A8H4B082_GIGMA|nr:hypothetical protein F8M41_025572 [Gigaspora margarita]
MTTKKTSYLLKEEDITDNGYQGLVTKLLDENFELPLGLLIKETNQEVIKEKPERKITKQNPQAIIQGKAEIYILQEWKQAFLNKKLEPRKSGLKTRSIYQKYMSIEDLGNELYIQVFQQFFIENPEPLTYLQKRTISKRVTEIEYKINNIGATRTRKVQKQVEAFQGFNVIRVVEEEYRLQIIKEELATALLYCALAKQEKLDEFLTLTRKTRYQV